MLNFIKASQFIRGAGLAFALLTFLSNYLPYAVLDMATLVHLIIMRWNSIAASIGAYISTLIGMPDIPAEIINAIIIGLSIGPFWSYTILKSEWGTHRGFVQNAAFGIRAFFGFFDGFVVAMMVVIAKSGPIVYLSIAFLLLVVITVLRRMPALRKGFVFILGALIAVEGVYLLSTPELQTAFDVFVCGEPVSIAPRCSGNSP